MDKIINPAIYARVLSELVKQYPHNYQYYAKWYCEMNIPAGFNN